MAAADDDVPPLEDCSAELEKLGLTEKAQSEQPKRELLEVRENSEPSCFKKGFLLGGSAKTAPAKPTAPGAKANVPVASSAQSNSQMPELKANPDANRESLVFDEVQTAIQQNASFLEANKTRWLNDELLKQVESNQFLIRMMAHPGINQILAEFQQDPKAAIKKYERNEEISRFFSEFTAILGTHFEQLSNQDAHGSQAESRRDADGQDAPQKSSRALISEVKTVKKETKLTSQSREKGADLESKVKDALSVPEVRDALGDPRVQRLIDTLRRSPDRGNELWREADGETRRKLQVLIQNGVLGVQK